MRLNGRTVLVLLAIASLIFVVIPTNHVLGAGQTSSRSWTVRQALSFCRAHPHTHERASSVRGYYFAFQPGAGPAVYGELLSSPSQVRDVLEANSVPARIDFGISVAIPLLGSNRVRRGPPHSGSWVRLTGQLSCYTGAPLAEVIVRGYRYG